MNQYFLSCDWGTSSLRMVLVKLPGGKPVVSYNSSEGIRQIHEQWLLSGKAENERLDFYLSFLSQKYAQLKWPAGDNKIKVIVSGMASATIGIIELPYASLPFSCNGEQALYKKIPAPAGTPFDEVVVVSGLRTTNDVMRGEETQLLGAFSERGKGKSIYIFPGTHSKHVRLSGANVTGIRTYMTGEIFGLLASQSILSGSVNLSAKAGSRQSYRAFRAGVEKGFSGHLLHEVFMIRTGDLLEKISHSFNKFYLSGLLIGNELKDLRSQRTNQITLVGNRDLMKFYRIALQVINENLVVDEVNAEKATVLGQLTIYKKIYRDVN